MDVCVYVTKSLIGQGWRMEESVIVFCRVLTPLYSQSASFDLLRGCMRILHAACDPHAACPMTFVPIAQRVLMHAAALVQSSKESSHAALIGCMASHGCLFPTPYNQRSHQFNSQSIQFNLVNSIQFNSGPGIDNSVFARIDWIDNSAGRLMSNESRGYDWSDWSEQGILGALSGLLRARSGVDASNPAVSFSSILSGFQYGRRTAYLTTAGNNPNSA
jgi:hypothetical protein